MDCPECGTPLVTYRLADREAPVCEQCGHVGIEAEHRAARARIESWTDALRRFYGTTADDEDLTVPVRAADWDGSSPRHRVETWAEALERFYGGTQPTATNGTGDDQESEDEVDETAVEPATPASVAFEGTPAVRRTDTK